MERPLQKNSIITLISDGKPTTFTIKKSLGDGGASCVAYEVTYEELCDDNDVITHRGILKEYFPHFLYEIGKGYERTASNAIVVPAESEIKFKKGLNDFKKSYKTIMSFLKESSSASNYHPTQIGLYEGNNTYYTLVAHDDGISYNNYHNNDLLTTLRLMLTATKAVEHYHRAGYLHLDIKPQNILILSDGITEIIKLFDYDSLTSITNLAEGKISAIPSPGYYVPELASLDIENIGISTDIFEIGATIYNRIFGCMPNHTNMEHDAVFDLDKSEITKDLSPEIKYELNILLKKALSINIPDTDISNDKELYNAEYKDNLYYRYVSTAELKCQLNKLINLVEKHKAYLVDLRNNFDICVSQYSIRFNRRNVTRELQKMLNAKGYAFLCGGEGYGKTDILGQFIKQYGKEYHTIQYYNYYGSLKAIIASIEVKGIEAINSFTFDELLSFKNRILHSSDKRTLIIIDNYDKADEYINLFLPKNENSFKVIFTSNNDSGIESENTVPLLPLSMESCEDLLVEQDSLSEKNKNAIYKIVEKCAFNPLVLSLISNGIYNSQISPSECLEIISEQQKSYDEDLSELYTYSTTSYLQLVSNIKVALHICKLTDAEKETLKALTLIPEDGILCSEFIEWCNSAEINYNVIVSLFHQGIVSLRDNGKKAFLHPTIRDYVSISKNFPIMESYHNLAAKLDYTLNPDTKLGFAETIRYLPHMQSMEKYYGKDCGNENKAFLKAQMAQYYLKIEHIPEAHKLAKKLDTLIDEAKLQNKTVYDDCLCYYNCLMGVINWKMHDHRGALSRFQIAYNVSYDIVEMYNKQFTDITICSLLLSALCNCDMETTATLEEKSNDDIALFDIVLSYARSHFKNDYFYFIAKKMLELSDHADHNAYPRIRYENIMSYNSSSPIKDMSGSDILEIIKSYTLLIHSLHKAKNGLYLESNRFYDHAMVVANKLYGGFLTSNIIYNYHYYMARHFLSCSNYPLASDHLQKIIELDVNNSGKLIRDTYVELKSNNRHKSMQGLVVLKYMALTYEYKNNPRRCLDVYQTFFDIYDETIMDLDGSLRIEAVCCCIKHHLNLNEKDLALILLNNEDDSFAKRFGENSFKRAELLISAGEILCKNNCPECANYYDIVNTILAETGYEYSMRQAQFHKAYGDYMVTQNDTATALEHYRSARKILSLLNNHNHPYSIYIAKMINDLDKR